MAWVETETSGSVEAAREWSRLETGYALAALGLAAVVTLIIVHQQYVHAYVGPTIVYGTHILQQATLADPTSIAPLGHLAHADLSVEHAYPVPGLIAASIMMVTGIPLVSTAFVPVSALLSLSFVALAFDLARRERLPTALAVATLSVGLHFVLRASALTLGRAALGVGLLGLFLLIAYRIITAAQSPAAILAGALLLGLVVAATSLTYYTATLAMVLALLGTGGFLMLHTRGKRGQLLLAAGSLGTYLFFLPPLHDIVPSGGPGLLHNLLRSFQHILLAGEGAGSQMRYFELPALLFLLDVWVRRILLIGILLGAGLVFLRYGPWRGQVRPRWILVVLVGLLAVSELSYLRVGTVRNSRFLQTLGLMLLIPALALLPRLAQRRNVGRLVVVLLALNMLGAAWYGVAYSQIGGAGPLAAARAEASIDFVLEQAERGEMPRLTGDANYMAMLTMEAQARQSLRSVEGELMWQRLDLLAPPDPDHCRFLDEARADGIALLALETHDPTVWGDEWGPAVEQKVFRETLERASPVRDDGFVRMATTRAVRCP